MKVIKLASSSMKNLLGIMLIILFPVIIYIIFGYIFGMAVYAFILILALMPLMLLILGVRMIYKKASSRNRPSRDRDVAHIPEDASYQFNRLSMDLVVRLLKPRFQVSMKEMLPFMAWAQDCMTLGYLYQRDGHSIDLDEIVVKARAQMEDDLNPDMKIYRRGELQKLLNYCAYYGAAYLRKDDLIEPEDWIEKGAGKEIPPTQTRF